MAQGGFSKLHENFIILNKNDKVQKFPVKQENKKNESYEENALDQLDIELGKSGGREKAEMIQSKVKKEKNQQAIKDL